MAVLKPMPGPGPRRFIAAAGDDELTDPDLFVRHARYYRLFHEDGVRVYPSVDVTFACRCGPERVRNVLSGFAPEELSDMLIDGKIEVTCEFCSSRYAFSPDDLKASDGHHHPINHATLLPFFCASMLRPPAEGPPNA